MDLRIPHLATPYTSVLNPSVREADEQVIAWVRSLGLAPSPRWVDGYRRAKFTWFSARCFPEADLPQLALGAAFNVWLFLLDDSCDEIPQGQRYEYVRQLTAQLTLALAGYPPADQPLVQGLADLWERLKTLSPPAWQERFVDNMLRYLDACKLEAEWLDMDAWPTPEAYTRYRPFLGAVHLEPALAEVLCRRVLPPRRDPRLDTLTLLCCRIVCWSNDLFSLQKEHARGDKGNLALVLQHAKKGSLKEAIREAAAIHDGDLQRFEALAGELPDNRYVTSLEHIISANMEWSIHDSRRYRFTFEDSVTA